MKPNRTKKKPRNRLVLFLAFNIVFLSVPVSPIPIDLAWAFEEIGPCPDTTEDQNGVPPGENGDGSGETFVGVNGEGFGGSSSGSSTEFIAEGPLTKSTEEENQLSLAPFNMDEFVINTTFSAHETKLDHIFRTYCASIFSSLCSEPPAPGNFTFNLKPGEEVNSQIQAIDGKLLGLMDEIYNELVALKTDLVNGGFLQDRTDVFSPNDNFQTHSEYLQDLVTRTLERVADFRHDTGYSNIKLASGVMISMTTLADILPNEVNRLAGLEAVKDPKKYPEIFFGLKPEMVPTAWGRDLPVRNPFWDMSGLLIEGPSSINKRDMVLAVVIANHHLFVNDGQVTRERYMETLDERQERISQDIQVRFREALDVEFARAYNDIFRTSPPDSLLPPDPNTITFKLSELALKDAAIDLLMNRIEEIFNRFREELAAHGITVSRDDEIGQMILTALDRVKLFRHAAGRATINMEDGRIVTVSELADIIPGEVPPRGGDVTKPMDYWTYLPGMTQSMVMQGVQNKDAANVQDYIFGREEPIRNPFWMMLNDPTPPSSRSSRNMVLAVLNTYGDEIMKNGYVDAALYKMAILGELHPEPELLQIRALSFEGEEDTPVRMNLREGNPSEWSYQFRDIPVGRVVLKEGDFTYEPPQNWNGTVTLKYQASFEGVSSNVADITIIVKPVNDAPVIVRAGSEIVREEAGVFKGSIVASDPENDSLTFKRYEGTGANIIHGDVTIDIDGSYTFLPAIGFSGIAGFSVTVIDSHGDKTSMWINVNIPATLERDALNFVKNDMQAKGIFLNPISQTRVAVDPANPSRYEVTLIGKNEAGVDQKIVYHIERQNSGFHPFSIHIYQYVNGSQERLMKEIRDNNFEIRYRYEGNLAVAAAFSVFENNRAIRTVAINYAADVFAFPNGVLAARFLLDQGKNHGERELIMGNYRAGNCADLICRDASFTLSLDAKVLYHFEIKGGVVTSFGASQLNTSPTLMLRSFSRLAESMALLSRQSIQTTIITPLILSPTEPPPTETTTTAKSSITRTPVQITTSEMSLSFNGLNLSPPANSETAPQIAGTFSLSSSNLLRQLPVAFDTRQISKPRKAVSSLTLRSLLWSEQIDLKKIALGF